MSPKYFFDRRTQKWSPTFSHQHHILTYCDGSDIFECHQHTFCQQHIKMITNINFKLSHQHHCHRINICQPSIVWVWFEPIEIFLRQLVSRYENIELVETELIPVPRYRLSESITDQIEMARIIWWIFTWCSNITVWNNIDIISKFCSGSTRFK